MNESQIVILNDGRKQTEDKNPEKKYIQSYCKCLKNCISFLWSFFFKGEYSLKKRMYDTRYFLKNRQKPTRGRLCYNILSSRPSICSTSTRSYIFEGDF